MSPLAALRDLARLEQLEVDRGVTTAMEDTSALFARGSWTTANSSAVQDNGRNGIRSAGYRVTNTFSEQPTIDGIYQFVGPDDLNVVCGTVRIQLTVTPAQHEGALLQNTARTNWGGWIAPGRYRKIRGQGLNQACLGILRAPQPEGSSTSARNPRVRQMDRDGNAPRLKPEPQPSPITTIAPCEKQDSTAACFTRLRQRHRRSGPRPAPARRGPTVAAPCGRHDLCSARD